MSEDNMDIIERLLNFGPDWTKDVNGNKVIPYEVCVDAADRIETDAKVIADLAAKCEVEFQARVEQAKVIAALREALETIAEPILHAERTAKASGERLNELAYQIYTSPENLRAMARDALKKLNEQNVGNGGNND